MAPAQTWSSQQDLEVFRKIVADTLAARSSHYQNPRLAPWSGHGGDKINKKIQQLLKKLGSQIPGAGEVVNEELAKVSKGKGKGGKDKSPSVSPKKRKRMVKAESEEDEEDFDDY